MAIGIEGFNLLFPFMKSIAVVRGDQTPGLAQKDNGPLYILNGEIYWQLHYKSHDMIIIPVNVELIKNSLENPRNLYTPADTVIIKVAEQISSLIVQGEFVRVPKKFPYPVICYLLPHTFILLHLITKMHEWLENED